MMKGSLDTQFSSQAQASGTLTHCVLVILGRLGQGTVDGRMTLCNCALGEADNWTVLRDKWTLDLDTLTTYYPKHKQHINLPSGSKVCSFGLMYVIT